MEFLSEKKIVLIIFFVTFGTKNRETVGEPGHNPYRSAKLAGGRLVVDLDTIRKYCYKKEYKFHSFEYIHIYSSNILS